MSDNEDLLGDDLGDQSLADYNLGNEEEEQLLADDYESGDPQNVPSSIVESYSAVEMVPSDFSSHGMEYVPPPMVYQPIVETECVVPNVAVDVPNLPPHSTYTPIEPRHYEAEHAVPPAIPAGPVESPQIVPSEVSVPVPSGDGVRERFISERPVGAQRMPQVRDIPDSLDKVVIPRGFPRGRASWRAAHFHARHAHPYRRNNVHRGNFNQRSSFPPPQQVIRPNVPQQIIRQEIRPEMRPEIRPEMIRPDLRPEMIRPDVPPEMLRPELRPDMMHPGLVPPDIRPEMIRQEIRPDLPNLPQMGPEISPERPILPDMSFRPPLERSPFFPRFQFRPDERPMFGHIRPNFERPMYPYPRQFNPRFGPPMREIVANSSHIPQVTIRQVPDKMPKEPEVRMLPVSLPPHIPPSGLAGKKVLINPHFKGNFQPPVEGPIKDIDDAAERFIAEQRNALARAATRKFPRRSPQRYIENTTIEIENELAHRPARRRSDDDDLLRRQEEFINANRAGLRRRMRSPSPPPARRSPSPRRARAEPPRERHDEESEYKRRLREQESLRERVLRAKEVRRRRNAVALHKQMQDRERETLEKNQQQPKENLAPTTKEKEPVDKPEPSDKPTTTEETKPDTTRKTPERKSPETEAKVVESVKEKDKLRERSPMKAKDDEVNSTCEGLTPPGVSPARTPPWLPPPADDDLELILGDIDGILSDDDDSGRFKDDKPEPPKSKPVTDLRSKLPPKHNSEGSKPPRQKIVFTEEKEERKKKEKTPPRRAVVSSTKLDDSDSADRKSLKTKANLELSTKSRQRITFVNKQKETEKDKQEKTPPFNNRRVILQRKVSKEKAIFSRAEERSQARGCAGAGAGMFSRAVRTLGAAAPQRAEPQVELASDSELDEDAPLGGHGAGVALVRNLPPAITDTRMRTLAGPDVQNLILDKEERSAKITFKTTVAAETFKRKFNNKMVAASRLSVSLR